jgi:hypothetical protein
MTEDTNARVCCWRSLATLITALLLVPLLACGGGSNGTPPSPQQPVSVHITSRPATVDGGSTYNFVASVAHTANSSVTWQITCPQGISDCGSIASTGVYSAPLVSAAMNVTVIATSLADPTKSDSVIFQVMPVATSVRITTRPGFVNAGLNYSFAATVTGATDSGVSWSISCDPSVTNCGAIGVDGTYTSPVSIAQQTLVTIKATSVADSNAFDTLGFLLLQPIAVSLMPATVQVPTGFSYPFSASVANDLQYVGVNWEVNGIPGGNSQVGTIIAVPDSFVPAHLHGLYTAPVTSPAGSITISAVSKVDATKSASGVLSLIANPHPNFSGAFAFLVSGPYGGSLEAAGGMMTLDGAGHLTGTVDIHLGSYQDIILPGLAVTGTYGFEGKDGGWATLTYTQAGQSASMSFKFILTSDTVAKVIEFDGMGGQMGTIEKQSPDYTSALSGNNVLALKGYQLNANPTLSQTYAVLAQFNGSNKTINGTWDMITEVGVDPPPNLIGWWDLPSRTLNLGFQGWTNVPGPDFFLYPVSADRSLILSKVSPVLVGTIDRQSAGTFTNATFTGDWVFYVASHPSLKGATLGWFSSDGSGVSGPGCIDSTGSSFLPPGCYSMFDLGIYYVSANGRVFAPLTQWGSPRAAYLYFIDQDHGYFGTQHTLGEFFRRQETLYTNSSLQGNYTVVFSGTQDWFWNAQSANRVGTATLDGNGNIEMVTSWVDPRNSALDQGLSQQGTYAFDGGVNASLGRGSMLFGSEWQLIYYAISPDKVLMIQFDYDDVAFGIMQRSAF